MSAANSQPRSEVSRVVERNIRALLEKRRDEEAAKTYEERIADFMTRFTGSMLFVYIHLFVFGVWIFANIGWISFIPKFDPSFVILAMAASVEAIFLSTFVLISQNRMSAIQEKRAELDLQISLLSEHEVTRLIQLVTEIARRMGVEQAKEPELKELAKDILPERVLEQMEDEERRAG
jgi:uncharacterized membrane protein